MAQGAIKGDAMVFSLAAQRSDANFRQVPACSSPERPACTRRSSRVSAAASIIRNRYAWCFRLKQGVVWFLFPKPTRVVVEVAELDLEHASGFHLVASHRVPAGERHGGISEVNDVVVVRIVLLYVVAED